MPWGKAKMAMITMRIHFSSTQNAPANYLKTIWLFSYLHSNRR